MNRREDTPKFTKGKATHIAVVAGIGISGTETNPHEREGNGLPDGVCHPLAQQGHENGAERVESNEDDRHYNAVSKQDGRLAGAAAKYNAAATTAGRAAAAAVSIAVSTTILHGPVHERVAVGLDGGLAEVEAEAGVVVVLLDALASAGRVDGTAGLPSRDPGASGRVEGHRAAAPGRAVGAEDIGGHATIGDAGAGKELEIGTVRVYLGHVVAPRGTRAEGDVAIAVGVHEEHVRVGHGRAGGESNPLIAGRGRHLEIQVSGAGAGSGSGDGDPEADIIGACFDRFGRGSCGVYWVVSYKPRLAIRGEGTWAGTYKTRPPGLIQQRPSWLLATSTGEDTGQG